MEVLQNIFKKCPHIGDIILSYLEFEDLEVLRLISGWWINYLEENKIYWKTFIEEKALLVWVKFDDRKPFKKIQKGIKNFSLKEFKEMGKILDKMPALKTDRFRSVKEYFTFVNHMFELVREKDFNLSFETFDENNGIVCCSAKRFYMPIELRTSPTNDQIVVIQREKLDIIFLGHHLHFFLQRFLSFYYVKSISYDVLLSKYKHF